MVITIVKEADNQLVEIKGGTVPYVWIGIAVAAVIVFLSGIIDGISNPKGCES